MKVRILQSCAAGDPDTGEQLSLAKDQVIVLGAKLAVSLIKGRLAEEVREKEKETAAAPMQGIERRKK